MNAFISALPHNEWRDACLISWVCIDAGILNSIHQQICVQRLQPVTHSQPQRVLQPVLWYRLYDYNLDCGPITVELDFTVSSIIRLHSTVNIDIVADTILLCFAQISSTLNNNAYNV